MVDNINHNYSYLNKITCETEVYLQIITPIHAIRLKTRLIGVDPNMSVILAMGSDHDWLAAKQYIREGQKVIVRLMSTELPDASIIAFQCHIQKIMSIAGRWLLLDYPKEVQQHALRQHLRLPIHHEAKLIDKETKKICSTGFLNDISIHGGAFIGEPIKSPSINQHYVLQFSLGSEIKSIEIIIKNSKKTDKHRTTIQYGLVLCAKAEKSKQFVVPLLLHCLLS